MKLIIIKGIFLMLFCNYLLAQDTLKTIIQQVDTVPVKKELPYFSAGFGYMTFFGDVANKKLNFPVRDWYHAYKLTYYFQIEIGHKVPLVLDLTRGYLAGIERSSGRNLNFESKLVQLSANTYYAHNFKKKKKNTFIKPFLTGGLSIYHFSTSADLYDAEGNEYFYWDDGTIRTISQTDSNKLYATIISKDYNYESKLIKSKIAFDFPMGFGVQLTLTNKVKFNIGTKFHYSFTEFIDNYSEKKKDKFYFTYFGLIYNINDVSDKIEEIKHFEQFDLLEMDKIDTDGDKVKDFKDRCPKTPLEIKTDRYGCPLDKDKDGISDYLDMEPESRKEAMVDLNGIEITTEDLFYLINLTKENHYVIPNISRGDSLYITNNKSNIKLLVPGLKEGTKIALYSIADGEELIFNNISKKEIYIVKELFGTDTLAVSRPGVIYKIELGQYKKQVSDTYFKTKGYTSVSGKQTGDGLHMYYYGAYKSFEEAEQEKVKAKDNGFDKADIVAFFNGKEIPLSKARKLK